MTGFRFSVTGHNSELLPFFSSSSRDTFPRTIPDPSPFSPKPSPQFATAEYAAKPGGDVCAACKAPITGRYYRINGALNCETCAEISRRQIPSDSHAAFVRAILFGIGGALLGLIIYSTFGIVTGLVVGYLSLAVGYIVGKAMNLGSRGLGGKRYQIAAVLLTYAAVSLSAIPIAISQSRKPPVASQVQNFPSGQSSSAQNSGDTPAADADDVTAHRGFTASLRLLATWLCWDSHPRSSNYKTRFMAPWA